MNIIVVLKNVKVNYLISKKCQDFTFNTNKLNNFKNAPVNVTVKSTTESRYYKYFA